MEPVTAIPHITMPRQDGPRYIPPVTPFHRPHLLPDAKPPRVGPSAIPALTASRQHLPHAPRTFHASTHLPAQTIAPAYLSCACPVPPSSFSYLPSCDDPAQRLGSSDSPVCMAQRGMGLLRASFGNLGGAIFAGLLCSFLFIDAITWVVA